MHPLRKSFNGRTFLGQETDCVVAGVVNGCGRNVELRSGLQSVAFGGQFVEACRRYFNTVDGERGFVAIDKVDKNLALLQYLVAGSGRHTFDGLGDVLGVSAGGGALGPQDDKDQSEADSGAHQEFLLVNWAFHGPILAVFCPRYTSFVVTR